MRDPESGNDGKEENDGLLVLRNVTVKYLVGLCKECNNRRKFIEQQLFYSRFNYDSGLLHLVSRKYLRHQPM